MRSQGRTKLTIHKIMGLEEEKARKMAEMAFRETDIEVTICAQSSGRKQAADAKERKEFNTEALTIKAEGQTYVELVKSVNQQLSDETVKKNEY